MGFTPEEVDRMALWQFVACVGGWAEANGVPKRGREMSDDRLAALGVAGFDG